jgi:3-hydroxy acid dehydrogenase / malonic semialdehyde reductase
MNSVLKTILITGATSGFGEATARILAQQGHRLILTGRRNERLSALKNELTNTDVITLCFDVRDEEAVNNSINSLPIEWKSIDVLINNAGLASGLTRIQEGNSADWNKMIDTNIKGLLYVTKAVLPNMIAQNNGHIINIGSTAAKDVYDKGNVYCATKFAVDALTKSMRIDLLDNHIKVSQISPGAAETEFSIVRFAGDTEKAKAAYKGYQPLAAEDIAQLIAMVINLPKNVCINDLVVTSLAQANSVYIHRQ